MASGKSARDALARRDAFSEDCLGERALGRPAADERQLVLRDEAGRSEQVVDELGDGVDLERSGRQAASGRARLAVRRVGGAQVGGPLGIHIPRTSYRHPHRKC